MNKHRIVDVKAMKSLDDKVFVAIIINCISNNNINFGIVISDKQITVNGIPIATEDTTETWKNSDDVKELKNFDEEQINQLLNDMNNEPFGLSMINKWKLTKEVFV
jgi:hypothetical protein